MDYEQLLVLIQIKISELEIETEFFLKDLFEGTEWKKLRTGEKLSLGRRFKNCVDLNKIPNVIYIGKAPNNSAKYKKCWESK